MYIKPKIDVSDAKKVINSAYKAAKNVDLHNTSFLGIMGSSLKDKEIGDIDIVLFPKLNQYEGIKDLFNYHSVLNEIVQKDHDLELSPFPIKAMQEDITYIISKNKDEVLPLHVLYFKDMNDFNELIPEEYRKDSKAVFENDTLGLKGSVLDIIDENPISSYEQNFINQITANQLPLIKDKYPTSLFKAKSQSMFNYLSKFTDIDINNNDKMSEQELSDLTYVVLDELNRAA